MIIIRTIFTASANVQAHKHTKRLGRGKGPSVTPKFQLTEAMESLKLSRASLHPW